jgi:hypothetical protein
MSEYFHWQEYGDRQPFEDLDEAVEDYLNDFITGEAWPEPVTIFGYSVKRIPVQDPQWVSGWASHIAESLWERLDEEFGNSDESQGVPDEVVKLAEQFVLAAAAHFDDHNIWPDGTSETINVHEWVLANRPEWLNDLTQTGTDTSKDTK